MGTRETVTGVFTVFVEEALKPRSLEDAREAVRRLSEIVKITNKDDVTLGYVIGWIWGSFYFHIYHAFHRKPAEEEIKQCRKILRESLSRMKTRIEEMK